MADRYFVESPISGAYARLVGGDAHHLAHVMRAKPGQAVTLFDGSGAEFEARIENIARTEVTLCVVTRVEADRELTHRLTLAVSLPKGDRQRWLIEKATELGVARIVPLVTARSVAQPVAAALARLRRAVIEASKQCGRNRLLEIAEPMSLGDYAATATTDVHRWLAHPRRHARNEVTCVVGKSSPLADTAHWLGRHDSFGDVRELIVAIGPEGGFMEEEVALALDTGWRQLDLGPRILRVETAAIAVAAWAANCVEGPQP